VTGEIAWGLLMGWIALRLRRLAHEPRVEIILAILTPFAAFWVPESLGGSGVLATVTAGLFVSWNGPRFIAPATRLQGYFVWDLVVYLIEGVIFLLTGLQAPIIADSLGENDWIRLGVAALSVTAAIILVRFAWVYASTYLPCWLWPRWRNRVRLAQTPAPVRQSRGACFLSQSRLWRRCASSGPARPGPVKRRADNPLAQYHPSPEPNGGPPIFGPLPKLFRDAGINHFRDESCLCAASFSRPHCKWRQPWKARRTARFHGDLCWNA
jgi:hypothetical protein